MKMNTPLWDEERGGLRSDVTLGQLAALNSSDSFDLSLCVPDSTSVLMRADLPRHYHAMSACHGHITD